MSLRRLPARKSNLLFLIVLLILVIAGMWRLARFVSSRAQIAARATPTPAPATAPADTLVLHEVTVATKSIDR